MTVTLVLVKAQDAMKRLSPCLSADERQQLMTRLARHVIAAAVAAGAPNLRVVARDRAAADVAGGLGVEVWHDPGGGPNPAAAQAVGKARALGASSVAVVAADLPLLQPPDLAALLRLAADDSVVHAPNRTGEGTNALVLPAIEFPFSFGTGSRRLHQAAAAERDLRFVTLNSVGLAADLDEPGDLDMVGLTPVLGTGQIPLID